MKNNTVMVTGGAGYIGSHCVISLIEKGFEVVVVDNLSTGHTKLIHPKAIFYETDISDEQKIYEICKQHSVGSCMHFAASIVVSESVSNPLLYYENNVANVLKLLKSLQKAKVNKFIFSSTAAVYGEPTELPIKEETYTRPINPYGHSKMLAEQVVKDFGNANKDFKYGILRYFNVAGADSLLRAGQISDNATHLIKVASEVAVGKKDKIVIYGNDYNTRDGTCIRDYIHVSDLANAHVELLNYLQKTGENEILNVGYGKGFSVQEVVNTMQKICTDKNITIEYGQRREGDPQALISDPTRIKNILGWEPKFEDLNVICRSALEWEKHLKK